MMGRATKMATAIAVAFQFAGCTKPAIEDESGPPKPPVVAFTGTAEGKFVGNWRTADGRSGLDLGKDGKLSILVIAASPSGDHQSTLTGSWLFDGTYLLLKYADRAQPEVVIRYSPALAGNKLTLLQVGARQKIVYTKK